MPLIYLCCLDTVEDLRILAEDDKQFEKVIPQGQLRTLIVRALSAATPGDQPSSHPGEDKGRESDDQPGQSKEQAQPKQDVSKLPPGVHFHYFASHKKQHSRFGRDSASEPVLAFAILSRLNPFLLSGVAGAQVQGCALAEVQSSRVVRRYVVLTLCLGSCSSCFALSSQSIISFGSIWISFAKE